jgi:acylphosphatase
VTAVHVQIKGRVQGVGFRAWVEDEASVRGLTGWVRNRANGDVEAVFAGPRSDVEAMIAACHSGPRAARVTAVETSAAAEENWREFSVLPTA